MRTERPTCRECACVKVCEYFENENARNLDETCPLCNWENYFVPKQEWISVDERLPKPYESVLVYMPGEAPFPTVREGFITKHGGWYAGGFDRLPDEIVMWQEIPEPPKMKGGAE